ncbi:MAG: pallilysin-related adhesin [Spirochaetales bacterium]|nr:pallilysin-related adhesin [Spirochaetales bacterium]
MKYKLITLLLCSLFFFHCSGNNNRQITANHPKKIIPKIKDGQFETRSNLNLDSNRIHFERQNLEIPLSPDDTLIQVINKNLDIDSQDEQIIAVKSKDNAESVIRVIVADFDSARGHYIKTWEGTTNAEHINTFTLNLKDVVGDYQWDLVCQGTNSKGDFTLNIFRRSPAFGFTLSYYPICSIISNGTIEIIEEDRSPSYLLGHTLGESFVIMAYRSDQDNEAFPQIIKETYYFSRPSGRYEIQSLVRLSSEKVEESHLKTIIASGTPDLFEEYLQGFWYKSGQEASNGANGTILFFDLQNREIVLYSGEVQEIYKWKGSKQFYKNLTIFAENKLLQSISPQFTITLSMIDQIKLSISEPSEHEQWGGKFIKAKKELEDSIFTRPDRKPAPPGFELAGRYASKDNFIIQFENPYLKWIEKDTTTFEGGYSLHTFIQKDAPINVLFLKLIIDNGLYVKDKVYILKYKEETQSNYILKTLTLIPAKLSVHGIAEKIEEPIIVTQETPL